MHYTLTVLDHAITGLIAVADLDPITLDMATSYVQETIQESRLRVNDDYDPMVNLAVLVRCMLLLTQLHGMLRDRDDYPDFLRDVESQVSAETIYQQACF